MKYFSKLSTLALSAVFSASSFAAITTYEVTNFNGGNGSHALWTNQDYTTDKTFDANSDLRFTIDDMGNNDVTDDVARLTGSVTATGFNPDKVAVIDLTFTGGLNTLDFNLHHYKKEGGLAYNDLLANNPTFWTDILGTIMIDNKIYDIDSHVVKYGKTHTFQFGVGANAKNKTELGGSSWVRSCQRAEGVQGANDCMSSHHWDLNLAMKEVPEPGSVALLMFGLAGLVFSRKQQA